MTEFLVLLNQVLVLFILMGLGYFLAKKEYLSRDTATHLTFLLCYVITPCIVFHSFQTKYEPERLHNLLVMFFISVLMYLGTIILGHLIFNSHFVSESFKRSVLRFSVVYGNCGFMGFPLLYTLLGADGVFYGSAYNGVFALFVWTHGIVLYTNRFDFPSLVKAMLNPNIFAIALGMGFFAFSLSLPAPVAMSVKFLADLNTGLSMIVVGVLITSLPLNTIINDPQVWIGVLLKNIIFPVIIILIAVNAGISGNLLMTTVIMAACPTASMAVMLAALMGRDTVFPSKIMILSTILSLLTVPAVIIFARSL